MFVKICGITSPDDALLAAGLGADAVGLVFASSSRRVTTSSARDIVRALPPEVLTVGVFRNERREKVVEIAHTIGLRAVQLHGNESPEDTAWVAAQVPSVIRAFSSTDPNIASFEKYGAERLLIDSSTPGSGKPFDWPFLTQLRVEVPFILAGGLDHKNVGSAIAEVEPWGVDVSTGVEERPGKKDPVKLRKFISAARSAPTPKSALASDRPFKPFDWEEDSTWK